MERKTLATRCILAAVDWNKEWQNTVLHAAARARALDARLHVVHVVEPTSWLLRKVLDDASLASHDQHNREVAEQHLAAARGLVEDIEVTTEIRSGKPTVQILEAITESEAGLLVVGMDNPKGATAIVLGGTTDRLLRLSPVPIYVAGPNVPQTIERILVPTGLGPSGAFAIRTAVEQLPAAGGTVSALHMVALPSVMRAYSGDVISLRRKITAQAQSELDEHLQEIHVPESVEVSGILRTNLESVPADHTIVSEAREQSAQLICFALGGKRFDHGLLIGSVSQKVIRALPCALLAVPDAWISSRS